MLSFVEKGEVAGTFVTFSDTQISDGGLYASNGFVVDSLLSPDYSYLVGGQRVHKFNYRKARFEKDPELLFNEDMTERKLAELNDIPRIWDSGKVRWAKRF